MALSAAIVWEVRPTNGLDTSGGGFKAGATGTDYSQQNSPQYALTGLTTAAANAIILTASAAADMVGNLINITSGTNFTTGIYEIISVSVGVSITVDRNCTSAAGASGVANVGGAIKTLTVLAANMVGSNKAFVKAESTITVSARITWAQSVTPSETVTPTHLIGYTSTRGDGGQVALTWSSTIDFLYFTGSGWVIEGFNCNCASLTNSSLAYLAASYCVVRNCKVSNAAYGSGGGISFESPNCAAHHCEITGCTSAAAAGILFAGMGYVTNCWIHDNACPGIVFNSNASGSVCTGNVISNNTGSSSDGIRATSGGMYCVGNVIYKNGRHGISLVTIAYFNTYYLRNNIITDQTAGSAAGLKCNTAALPADPRWDGNFYYNNTSNRVNMDDTTTNAVDGVAPYTNVFDVILSGSPFTNAAGNDFTLNNTAGAGAAVRGHGLPGTGGTLFSGIPGLTTLNGYLDGGVFQHQDPTGGGGLLVCLGMRGGMQG